MTQKIVHASVQVSTYTVYSFALSIVDRIYMFGVYIVGLHISYIITCQDSITFRGNSL